MSREAAMTTRAVLPDDLVAGQNEKILGRVSVVHEQFAIVPGVALIQSCFVRLRQRTASGTLVRLIEHGAAVLLETAGVAPDRVAGTSTSRATDDRRAPRGRRGGRMIRLAGSRNPDDLWDGCAACLWLDPASYAVSV